MEYEWDEIKHERNIAKHGVSFEDVALFEWSQALIIEDDRHDYAEVRYAAYGFIKGRLHVCVYTHRGDCRRIISLRKANGKEVILYEKAAEKLD